MEYQTNYYSYFILKSKKRIMVIYCMMLVLVSLDNLVELNTRALQNIWLIFRFIFSFMCENLAQQNLDSKWSSWRDLSPSNHISEKHLAKNAKNLSFLSKIFE